MKGRIWLIRISSIIILSLLSYILSLKSANIMLSYINLTFMIGLFLLMLSALFYITLAGFFTTFVSGWKKIFVSNNKYNIENNNFNKKSDYTHEIAKKEDMLNEINILRDNAKKELLIYLPFTTSIALIIQSISLMYYL